MIENYKNVQGGDGKTHPTCTINNNREINYCIDWFTCTFDFVQFSYKNAPPGSWQANDFKEGKDKLKRLYELLTFPDTSEHTYDNKNIGGYKDGSVELGEFIKIWFTGSINKNMLYHNKLDMSGQACSDFVNRGGSWRILFDWLLNNGANFTRVDVAIDTFTDKYFTIKKLYDYVQRYSYVSPLQQWSYMMSGDKTSETISGETLYIGSMSSNTLLCIYDKKLERYAHGAEIFDDVWIRFEVRFKKDRANWFVANYLKHDNNYSFIPGALYTVIDFKDRNDNDSNNRRWHTCIWWLEFLQKIKKVDFAHRKNESTIIKKLDWLDRSVSKSLNQIYLYNKNDFFINILKLVNKKNNEFTEKDLKIINDQRQRDGVPVYKMEDIIKMQDELLQVLKNLKDGKDD